MFKRNIYRSRTCLVEAAVAVAAAVRRGV